MADFGSVIQTVNDLVSRIDALSDVSEIGIIVERLDFLNRMLVNLDIDQDIIDTIGTLHSTAAAMEKSANASGGYYPIPGGRHLGIFGVGMCRPGLQIGTPF